MHFSIKQAIVALALSDFVVTLLMSTTGVPGLWAQLLHQYISRDSQ